MSCFRQSLCNIIHKRNEVFTGIFKTEFGRIRILQCVLVVMNFFLINYSTDKNKLSIMLFDMFIIFNTFIFAYNIASILTVMLCMVDIYLYELLHIFVCKALALMSIFQVIAVSYTLQRNSSLARAIFVSTSVMLTISVIYDWYFGKRILTNKRPKEHYSWYYFNGADTASCYSKCTYLLSLKALEQGAVQPSGEFEGNIKDDSGLTQSETETKAEVERSKTKGKDISNMGGTRDKTIAKDEALNVKEARTNTITKDESLNVGGARIKTKTKDETLNLGGARRKTKTKDEALNVGGARRKTLANDEALNVGRAKSETKAKVFKKSRLTHSYVNEGFSADELPPVDEEKEIANVSYDARIDEHKAIILPLKKGYGAVQSKYDCTMGKVDEPQSSITAAKATEKEDGSNILHISEPVPDKIMNKIPKETTRNPKILLQDSENGTNEIFL